MEDREQQQEELLAMGSIYGHDGVFMSDESQMTGVISVPVELPQAVPVKPPAPGQCQGECRSGLGSSKGTSLAGLVGGLRSHRLW